MNEDTMRRATEAIKHAAADANDALHEAEHRTAADTERAHRELHGDTMTASQKLGSQANELKHRAQAEVDKAKRDLRDHG